jgi:hypothetical protein
VGAIICKLAFNNYDRDVALMLRICDGSRPAITESTPSFRIKLKQKRWSKGPQERPTAHEITEKVSQWDTITHNILKQVKHLRAVYKSHFIRHVTKEMTPEQRIDSDEIY